MRLESRAYILISSLFLQSRRVRFVCSKLTLNKWRHLLLLLYTLYTTKYYIYISTTNWNEQRPTPCSAGYGKLGKSCCKIQLASSDEGGEWNDVSDVNVSRDYNIRE